MSSLLCSVWRFNRDWEIHEIEIFSDDYYFYVTLWFVSQFESSADLLLISIRADRTGLLVCRRSTHWKLRPWEQKSAMPRGSRIFYSKEEMLFWNTPFNLSFIRLYQCWLEISLIRPLHNECIWPFIHIQIWWSSLNQRYTDRRTAWLLLWSGLRPVMWPGSPYLSHYQYCHLRRGQKIAWQQRQQENSEF